MRPPSSLLWRRFAVDTAWSSSEIERELGILFVQLRAQGECRQGSQWLGGFRVVLGAPPMAPRAVVLSGKVQPTRTGSRVVMVARLPIYAMLFLAVGVPGLVLLSLAASVVALVRHELVGLLIWTAPFAMWGTILLPFQSEADRVEDSFRKFFPPPLPPNAGPFR